MQVIKRDGRAVPFDRVKIVRAIEAAMKETDAGVDREQSLRIARRIPDKGDDLTVEQIQDMIESMLMNSARKDVARKYVLYRAERDRQRDMKSAAIHQVRMKTNGVSIENANANVDEHTYGGRKNEAAGILQKVIALDYNMDSQVAKAHREGLIYQHDLDHYNIGAHNCLMIDFQKLFKEGFKTRNCDVRPPTSFSTACQLVAVIMQLQSQCQYGGVGAVHIDTDLAPFVLMSFKRHLMDGLKYIDNLNEDQLKELSEWLTVDKSFAAPNEDVAEFYKAHERAVSYARDMLEKEGKQAAQALWHNLGTQESRAGAQVPFSSLNYGRDTSLEGRLVTRWFLEASLEGVGKHHNTSIFPISIFSYKKGYNANKGDPNYDLKKLAIKSLSRRIFPNICNGDWSEAHEDPNNPDTIFSTMGQQHSSFKTM